MSRRSDSNKRSKRGQTAELRGRWAETWAAALLICKFYRILGWRVKTQAGEIDLIAQSVRGVLCFIEVKARGQESDAAEAISQRQRARIARAAALYMSTRPSLRHKGVRFDAVLILPRRLPRHIRDAWRPEMG